jgi:hypothetical protein
MVHLMVLLRIILSRIRRSGRIFERKSHCYILILEMSAISQVTHFNIFTPAEKYKSNSIYMKEKCLFRKPSKRTVIYITHSGPHTLHLLCRETVEIRLEALGAPWELKKGYWRLIGKCPSDSLG